MGDEEQPERERKGAPHLPPAPPTREGLTTGKEGPAWRRLQLSSLIQTTNLEILLVTRHLATESSFTTQTPKHSESCPQNPEVLVWE